MFQQVIRFEWQGEGAVAKARELLDLIKQNEAAMTSLTEAPAKVERAFESAFASAVSDMQTFSRQSEAAASSFANAFIDNIARVRASIASVDQDLRRTLSTARQDVPTESTVPQFTNASGQQVPRVLIPTAYGGARDVSSYTQDDVLSEQSAMWVQERQRRQQVMMREIMESQPPPLAGGLPLYQLGSAGGPGFGFPQAFYGQGSPMNMGRSMGGEFNFLSGQGPGPIDAAGVARQQYDAWLQSQQLNNFFSGNQGHPAYVENADFVYQARKNVPSSMDDFIQQYRGRAPGTDPNMEGMAKNVARDDYERFRQLQLINQEVERGEQGMGAFNNQWVRFGSYIAVGMAIHSTLVMITQEIANAFNQAVMFESIANRLAVISGNQPGQNTGQIMSQYGTMAQYGVQPDQSGFGLVTGMQAGANQGQMRDAARIAQFVGDPKSYTNALQELLQTQYQAEAAGIRNINVLDYLATAYASVATNARDSAGQTEVYFDSLQAGIVLSEKLGMTSEQAALAIGKVAFRTESAPGNVASTIERVFAKIISPTPKVSEGLEQFGITAGGDTSSTIRQISAEVSNLIATGRQAEANKLLQVLFGGTPMQGGDLQKAVALIQALNAAFSEAPIPLQNFNEASTKMADFFQASTQRMKASWEVFLASLGSTGPVKAVMEGTSNVLDVLANNFRGQASWGQLSPEEKKSMVEEFNAISKPQGLGTVGVGMFGMPTVSPGQGTNGTLLQNAFFQWMQDRQAGPGAQFGSPQGAMTGMPSTGFDWRTMIPPSATENLLNLPEGMSMSDFTKFNQRELGKLNAIPNYTGDDERTNVAIMGEKAGETGSYLATMNVNLLAANNAIRAWKESVDSATKISYGGIRDMPEGMDFTQLQQRTQYWQSFLDKTVGRENAPLQKQFFIDQDSTGNPVGRAIVTSQDALRLALDELTKIEKQKITGTFNIPAGGEFLVPFFALQSGFVGSDRVPGGGGGAGGAGRGGGAGVGSTPPIPGMAPPGRPAGWDGGAWFDHARAQAEAMGAGHNLAAGRAPTHSVPDRSGNPLGARVAEREHMADRRDDVRETSNIVINNRIQVVIDGKTVAHTLNTKMGQSMTSARRGVSGGAGRGLLM